MTMDLWMLVASAGLCWALILADVTPSILIRGVVWSAGNREEAEDAEGVHGRIHRTNLNLQENLPLFAILVLVAHVSGEADATTALGAQIFFGARMVHAGVYIAGISFLRTAIWSVSIVGMAMIASALF